LKELWNSEPGVRRRFSARDREKRWNHEQFMGNGHAVGEEDCGRSPSRANNIGWAWTRREVRDRGTKYKKHTPTVATGVEYTCTINRRRTHDMRSKVAGRCRSQVDVAPAESQIYRMGKRTGRQGRPMANHTRKKNGPGVVNNSGKPTSDLGLHERGLSASTEKYRTQRAR
jgi:hypothetical protein